MLPPFLLFYPPCLALSVIQPAQCELDVVVVVAVVYLINNQKHNWQFAENLISCFECVIGSRRRRRLRRRCHQAAIIAIILECPF